MFICDNRCWDSCGDMEWCCRRSDPRPEELGYSSDSVVDSDGLICCVVKVGWVTESRLVSPGGNGSMDKNFDGRTHASGAPAESVGLVY